MTASVMRFDNEADWLAHRGKVIGASEVPVLFGQGHTTIYQLWHEKAGNIEPENLDGALPVMVGRFLEDGLKKLIMHFNEGLELRKAHRYLQHPTERLGVSLDFELLDPADGWVPCETKILDWQSFSEGWEETEIAGEYDPPLKFSLQLQTQMLVTGKPRGHLFALVGNRQLVHVEQAEDPEIQELILTRVKAFWNSIEANDPPPINYHEDLATMYRVLTNVDDGREINVTNDPWWEAAFVAYKEASEREKAAKDIKDQLRAEVLDRMGPAIRARAANGTISAKLKSYGPNTVRTLRITPKRGLQP